MSTKHNMSCPWNSVVHTTGHVQCLQEQSSVYNTSCPWCVYRNSPVSTKHNNHVHGVFTGTVQCLQNTTIMSMVCLQEQSSVYKTQQHVHVCLQEQSSVQNTTTCPWCVYRNSPVSTKHTTCLVCLQEQVCLQNTTGHVHVCLQEHKNTTIMSMVCLQEQSSVYKTQQTCPWCVYRNSPVSTKHNRHVHGVFTGTPVSTKHNRHVHGVFTGTVQCLQNTTIMAMCVYRNTQNTTIMSMVCLQEQSGVYKTQQSCPWCVYTTVRCLQNTTHVHGVFTGTVRCLQNTTIMSGVFTGTMSTKHIMSMVCLQEQSSAYKTHRHVHVCLQEQVCLQNTTIMSMVCLQEQASVYKTQPSCPWCVYRNSPVSTKHNRHVHGVFTGTVQCLQNTTIMSMVCLQEQSGVYKTQQSCPWCVYRNSPVSTKHNHHVHGDMSMVCLQEQSSVYKTQQTCPCVFTGTVVSTKHNRTCPCVFTGTHKTQQSCPWCVYRNSPVSTKHNKHVHGVFTGTVQCLQNTTNMSMVCLQEQSSVYKTQQTCPWCVYRNSPVSTKHNRHVHGVFTGTVQCLQNTTDMSMVCLQEQVCLQNTTGHVHGVFTGQSSVYKTQQTCPWCVYRNSPVSTKHNRHVHGVFTGTVQCLQNTTKVSMTCLQGQSSVYKLQQTSSRRVYRDSPTI